MKRVRVEFTIVVPGEGEGGELHVDREHDMLMYHDSDGYYKATLFDPDTGEDMFLPTVMAEFTGSSRSEVKMKVKRYLLQDAFDLIYARVRVGGLE